MSWFINTFGTSIGKKWMMAITGLSFCGFLVFHLLGNLTIYGGPELFSWYVDHLHSLGAIIKAAEWVLLLLFLVHVTTGLLLAYENYKARPVRYSVKKDAGGRTLGSRSMAITGIIILMFIVLHLLNFSFIDRGEQSVFQIVTGALNQPLLAGIYIFAMAVAALHVSHGFWSAFQTLGAGSPSTSGFFRNAGIVLSLVVGFGFGFIPLFISIVS